MSDMTKKALAYSLKKLMNTTPLAKITVNDIVKDCEVNRRHLLLSLSRCVCITRVDL